MLKGKHVLLGVDGYSTLQAICSCGWKGHKWNNISPEPEDEIRADRNARNDWEVHDAQG